MSRPPQADMARVQDYLDGRLDEAQRRTFELRLHDEPQLAREVERLRALSAALREAQPESAEPSAGFYTRARARFEASRTPPRRFRLISWETAGLTATVLLVAALFVPAVLRRDEAIFAPQESAERQTTMTNSALPGSPRSDEVAPAPLPPPEPAADDRAAASPPGDREHRAASPTKEAETNSALPRSARSNEVAPAPIPPPARLEEEAAADDRAAPPVAASLENLRDTSAPADREPRAAPPAKKVERDATAPVEQRFAPAPPPLRAAEPGPAAEADARAVAVTPSERALAEQQLLGQSRRERQGFRSQPTPAVTLTRPVVARGEVRVVRDPVELDALRRSDPGLESLPVDPRLRLVLIGPREFPLNCAGIVHEQGAMVHVVSFPAAGPEAEGAPFGCALTLPDDGRAIEITVAPGDDG